MWQNENFRLDAEARPVLNLQTVTATSVFFLLLLSELERKKKYQDSLHFSYYTLNIGQIMWETDRSRLDFLAVLYLIVQKARNSVGYA